MRVARALLGLGHCVWMAGPAGEQFSSIAEQLGLPFIPVEAGPLKMRMIVDVARFARRERVQFLHARHGRDYWPAIFAAHLSGTRPKIVLSRHLAQVAPGARVFVLGEPPLLDEMRQAGLQLAENPAQIDYVVAAFDRTFDYHKWNIAFQAIKFHGAHFVATNPDRTCPVEGGEVPDCAGIIAALEATTGKPVELIAGKPSPMMIQAASALLGLPVEQCLVVGDRLETDILMGREAGARTAVVLTGVTRREHLATSPVQPDYVLQNIGGLLDLLDEAADGG